MSVPIDALGRFLPRKDPDLLCAVDGCGRQFYARGWCSTHYERWRRSGDVSAHQPIEKQPHIDPLAMSRIMNSPDYDPGGTRVIEVARGDDLFPVLVDENFVVPRRLLVTKTGYVTFTLNGRSMFLHRYILGLVHRDGRVCDHINKNGLDNRRANLRIVDVAGNAQNVSGRGVSRYLGVCRNGSGWRATATLNKRTFHLGTFQTEEEAALVSHNWRMENHPFYVPRNGLPGAEQ